MRQVAQGGALPRVRWEDPAESWYDQPVSRLGPDFPPGFELLINCGTNEKTPVKVALQVRFFQSRNFIIVYLILHDFEPNF